MDRDNMLFYGNFERLARLRGTSPSGVTTALGYGATRASDWKRNVTLPKLDQLYELAEHLNCHVSDFFKTDEEREDEAHGKGKVVYRELPGTAELDDNCREFVSIYLKAGVRQRNQLMNAVFDFEEKVLNC